MEKPAQTHFPIHDLLARRWSPRAFDERPVDTDVLLTLLEAARWAPSSNNEQPWRFIAGSKPIIKRRGIDYSIASRRGIGGGRFMRPCSCSRLRARPSGTTGCRTDMRFMLQDWRWKTSCSRQRRAGWPLIRWRALTWRKRGSISRSRLVVSRSP